MIRSGEYASFEDACARFRWNVPERRGEPPDDLIAWCGTRLSAFKVPEVVEFRDAFPRTSVGKIQKHLF